MGNLFRAFGVPVFAFFLVASAVICSGKPAEAGGASLVFGLQPIAPQTTPPSSYPPGTVINGHEIILGSVPARVWLEMYVTGWAPDSIRTVQVTISATDPEQDGGGYAGSAAVCKGQPANGGDLTPALVPCGGFCSHDPSKSCATYEDCHTCEGGTRDGQICTFQNQCPGGTCPSQTGRTCEGAPHEACLALSESSCDGVSEVKCARFDGLDPNGIPAGFFCAPGYQDKCHPGWIGNKVVGVFATDLESLNFRFGFAADPGEQLIDFHPSYVGTLVLDVPADAKGTYTIDFDETQTFYHRFGWPRDDFPIGFILPALVTVPCGSCCHDLDGATPQCVDHVSANECAAYGVGAVFQANEVCPEAGGPACPECGLDEHCDDGLFCNGPEVCEANTCGPGVPPCEPYDECEEEKDSCTPRIPAVSTWGLVILGLLILLIAKLRWKEARNRASV